MLITYIHFKIALSISLATSGLYPISYSQNMNQQQGVPEVVRMSSDELQKLAIKRVEPEIPPYMKWDSIKETILIEVKIDQEGNVISARHLSGDTSLRSSAIRAAKEWKFTPLKLDGRGVKVVGDLVFDIQNGDVSRASNTAVDEEISTLKQKIGKYPDSATLQLALGTAYAKKYLYLKAIEAYKNAIRINPDFSEAHYRLGEIFYTQEGYEEAIEAYKQVIRTRPDLVDAYFGLARSYERLSRFDEAIDTYERVMRVNSELWTAQKAYLNISTTYEDIGRNVEAIAAYRKLIEIETQLLVDNPKGANLRDIYAYWIARIYEKMADNEKAIEAYRLGISFRPVSGDAHDAYLAIGAIYEKTDRNKEAEMVYKKVAKLWSRWGNSRLALGRLYLKIGDKDAAMKEYNAIKMIDPKMANELLGEIRK
jgi:tetratricopeptide (TPR) repeat protein